jgi:hypothetical protein
MHEPKLRDEEEVGDQVSIKATAGDSILLGYYSPGFAPPPIPEDIVIVGVTEHMAANSYYVGAIMHMPEYGSLAVFKDKDTGVCYAQGVAGT